MGIHAKLTKYCDRCGIPGQDNLEKDYFEECIIRDESANLVFFMNILASNKREKEETVICKPCIKQVLQMMLDHINSL